MDILGYRKLTFKEKSYYLQVYIYFINIPFMSHELTQTHSLQNPEILLIDVIEDFVTLKKSLHTQRSYKSDLIAFFNSLEVCFLNDLALIPYPTVVDKIR